MEFLLLILCAVIVPPVSSGRHDGLRSLNEMLIDSQSARAFTAQKLQQPHIAGDIWSGVNIVPPKKKQSKEKKLRRILGDDFDERWVSVNKPEVTVSRGRSRQSDHDLTSELSAINTSVVMADKGLINLAPGVSKLLEKWLLQRARCDVTFIWEDVGDLFWPRWLKRGVCGTGRRDIDGKYLPGFVPRPSDDHLPDLDYQDDDDEENSCSWPPGMHCVPASSSTVQVLRWHCYPRWVRIRHREESQEEKDNSLENKNLHRRDRKRRRKMRIKCNWIKVPYPVTSECYCSC